MRTELLFTKQGNIKLYSVFIFISIIGLVVPITPLYSQPIDANQQDLCYDIRKKGNTVWIEIQRLRCLVHFHRFEKAYEQVKYVEYLRESLTDVETLKAKDVNTRFYLGFAAYIALKLGKNEQAIKYYSEYKSYLWHELEVHGGIKKGIEYCNKLKPGEVPTDKFYKYLCINITESLLSYADLPVVSYEYWPVKRAQYIQNKSKQDGYAIVEFTISKEGDVVNPIIIESNPKGIFNNIVLNAVNEEKYLPRVINGQALEVHGVKQKIIFGKNE
jgi:TonB family protein